MNKKDNIDIELGKILKQQSFQETDNEWFTPRVLNKLPAKGSKAAKRVAWAFYLAAIAVCVGWWWLMLSSNDPTVITVRDILYMVIACVVTMVLVFTPLVTMLRRE